MTSLTHRPFHDDRDLARMLMLVSDAARQEGVLAGHLSPGDVVWGLFQNLTIDPAARIRLFEDATGVLRGFVWLYPPDAFELHVDPSSADAADVLREMAEWAEAHLRTPATLDALTLTIPEPDTRLQSVARSLGYQSTGEAEIQLNHRTLDGSLPAPSPPDGAVVRPVRLNDAAEVAARVALHREVWHPSRFTAEGYARQRTKPVYRTDLDLILVTAAGELASYCIVWWDPGMRTAELEPVGTAARFRGRGYGKALLLDALARVRGLGAEQAIVVSLTGEAGTAARALYASVGFRRAFSFERWTKPPAGA